MSECTLLHAMLPVSDLNRSLALYTQIFGFLEIRRIQLEKPTQTLVFIGAASTQLGAMLLELL